MFGLVGLALYHESKAGPTVSMLGAILGGALTTFLISRIFRTAKKLESSGTIKLENAVGLTGTVYLGIAPNKPGKVTLTMAGRLLTLDATSPESLETGSEVRVVRVLNDGTVSVVKA
jgi:membrane-bound ClpP family serine protease